MARIDNIISELCRENDELKTQLEYWKKEYFKQKTYNQELVRRLTTVSEKSEVPLEEKVLAES